MVTEPVEQPQGGIILKRKISVLLAALLVFGTLQLATPAPANACADPNCPWSPITSFVGDKLWWIRHDCQQLLPDLCPL